MSLYLDEKYLQELSGRLRNFKQRSSGLWNFSCPFCGDSKRDRYKARGYVYQVDSKYLYTCHNCGRTTDIPSLIKHVDEETYRQYRFEKFTHKHNPKENVEKKVFEQAKKHVELKVPPYTPLQKISDLPPDHYARKYVENRMIPEVYWDELFHVEKFKEWSDAIVSPRDGSQRKHTIEEARLVIPFIGKRRVNIGCQGRAYGPAKIKYLTVIFTDEIPFLYGLNRLNLKKKIFCFEGPIDSMFIPNACASAGGDIYRNVERLGIDRNRTVLIFDNEPRNQYTVKKMKKAVDLGYPVCVWPNAVMHYKDVNQMVLGGMSPEEIFAIINEGVRSGMEAKLAISLWDRSRDITPSDI